MHRPSEHVIQFLFAEMGTTGSVDGMGRLVIKGRFQPKQVENVLRRYIGGFLHFPVLRTTSLRFPSRVCYMQDLQVARHTSDKREPYLLHIL